MQYLLMVILTFSILMIIIEVGSDRRPDLFPEKDRAFFIGSSVFGGLLYPLTWFILFMLLGALIYHKLIKPIIFLLRNFK
jgi:hypothetical protein